MARLGSDIEAHEVNCRSAGFDSQSMTCIEIAGQGDSHAVQCGKSTGWIRCHCVCGEVLDPDSARETGSQNLVRLENRIVSQWSHDCLW